MRPVCQGCGRPLGTAGRVSGISDLIASFAESGKKEVVIHTIDDHDFDGILEESYKDLAVIRLHNKRKMWIPLDKIVSVEEGRSPR